MVGTDIKILDNFVNWKYTIPVPLYHLWDSLCSSIDQPSFMSHSENEYGTKANLLRYTVSFDAAQNRASFLLKKSVKKSEERVL